VALPPPAHCLACAEAPQRIDLEAASPDELADQVVLEGIRGDDCAQKLACVAEWARRLKERGQ
jgi:hypothetical protein